MWKDGFGNSARSLRLDFALTAGSSKEISDGVTGEGLGDDGILLSFCIDGILKHQPGPCGASPTQGTPSSSRAPLLRARRRKIERDRQCLP